VNADGNVAIAGAVSGSLANADPAKGGADSFVAMFDSTGKELWTTRRGASSDDQANAIVFAPDGSLLVAGQSKNALGNWDGTLSAISSSGAEVFKRQFGTSGDDDATAIALRDAGGGAVEITTGGVENGRGAIRQFTYSPAQGLTAGATRDLGAFGAGASITSL